MKKCLLISFLLFDVFFLNAKSSLETYFEENVDLQKPLFQKSAVIVDKASLLESINENPWFGIGDDNYFCTGIPLNHSVNKNTSDAKFQLSAQIRVTKCVLPFNSYLAFRYTQKSFWNIYKYSCPFRDHNFNPALGVVTPVMKDNRLLGTFALYLEHESNGRDSVFSRSQNFLSASYLYFFNPKVSLQTEIWGSLLAQENKDLYDYRGFFFVKLNVRDKSDRLSASLKVNPNLNFSRWNVTADCQFRISKKWQSCLFVQFYSGYGENLLDYDKYTCMLRAGFNLKSSFFGL